MFVVTRTPVATVIAERGRRRRLDTGEMLFREADPSTNVYECISGRIRLVVSAAGGRELLLDVELPGDVFGELSAIDGGGRSATAVAMEPTVVAELSGAEYVEVVRSNPELAMISLRGLARQLRRANARIRAGETETVAARTAHLLLELAERFARDDSTGLHAVVPITQTDLAEWLGATRETTARALAELRRAGVIATARSRITVKDPAALAALAGFR